MKDSWPEKESLVIVGPFFRTIKLVIEGGGQDIKVTSFETYYEH